MMRGWSQNQRSADAASLAGLAILELAYGARSVCALSGGAGKISDPSSSYRADYVSKCLTAKGFSLERVDAE